MQHQQILIRTNKTISLFILALCLAVFPTILNAKHPEKPVESNTASANTYNNRISLKLNSEEKIVLLSEMRVILTSIQQILLAISINDKDLLIKSAKGSGHYLATVLKKVKNKAYFEKTPLAFEKLGALARMQFEELSIEASEMDFNNLDDIKQINKSLSIIMESCLACHAIYRY